MATAVTNDPYASLNTGSTGSVTKNDADSADRFLKLLVTQMQNQDPLNPMDNAQVTSQMAQINTVSGIEKLNTSVEGLGAQFMQMQALQGAGLIGHEITLEGNKVLVEGGKGSGQFNLAGKADAVKVEILNPAGRVVKTIDMGGQTAGRQAFDWAATGVADGADHSFRVTATNGTKAVTSTPLMRDQVQSISTAGGSLVLQTRYLGDVAYSAVKAFK